MDNQEPVILHPLVFKFISVFLAVFIFYLSTASLEGTGASSLPSGSDKAAHAVLYGMLTASTSLALGFTGSGNNKILTTAFSAVMLYGLFMEILQHTMPHRTFSVMDIVANLMGGLLAVIFLSLWGNRILLLEN